MTSSLSQSFVFKMLKTKNEKPASSNSSALKSVFEKLRFRDEIAWTVGLTVDISLFSNSSRVVWSPRPDDLLTLFPGSSLHLEEERTLGTRFVIYLLLQNDAITSVSCDDVCNT